MDDVNKLILIYTTFATEAEAEKVGSVLVDARLAACVNIFPGMTSIYEWEGRCEQTKETAMLIKTRRGLQEAVLEQAKSLHSYDNPALLVFEATGGSEAFLNWIVEQTKLN